MKKQAKKWAKVPKLELTPQDLANPVLQLAEYYKLAFRIAKR